MQAGEKRTYHTLDGMRGVAAIAVVVLHAKLFGAPLAPSAYLAPDLFFVLSGFVLSFAYEHRLASDLSAFNFTIIRLIRLYPLYFLGTAIGFCAAAAGATLGVSSEAWNARSLAIALGFGLMFLPMPPNALNGSVAMFPLNGPAWSLFYEALINIVYAALFRHITLRRLLFMQLLTGATLFVLVWSRGTLAGGWNTTPGQMLIALLRISFSFSIGISIFRIRHNLRFRMHPLIILSIVALLLCAEPPAGWWVRVLDLASVFLIFPLLVMLGANSEPEPKFLPLYRTLGITSYAVYALHRPMLGIAEILDQLFGLGLAGSRLLEALTIALIVALAYLIDSVFDKPVRKWLAGIHRSYAVRQSTPA